MFTWPFRRRSDRVLDADEAYARWAPVYPAAAHNGLMEVEERTMRALLPCVNGLTVLDAGCGAGRYMNLLARAGARRVLGVDRSAAMLQRADTSAARVFRADLREMPFAAGTIDVVVSALVFMDVPELTPALREIARVLRVGGVLVYSVLHPDGAARGWTRTFDSPGGRHVVRAWWHSIDDQQRACLDAGLIIEATREPCLDQGSGGPRVPVARVVRARRVA